jgi:hypothetical protein
MEEYVVSEIKYARFVEYLYIPLQKDIVENNR